MYELTRLKVKRALAACQRTGYPATNRNHQHYSPAMTTFLFVSPLPLQSHRARTSISAPRPQHPYIRIRPTRRTAPYRAPVRASMMQDFLAGPSSPPRPRPLYQVILFTVTTNLLWYGWYKYCIEQELRQLLGEGPGGIGALLPFIVGVTSPLYLPTGGPAELGAASGVLWIVGVQFYLYRRINSLMVKKGASPPLTPWWIVIPGFNLVVGLRSVHFLSVAFGADADSDPVVDIFPFLGKDTLGMGELLVNPSLWLRLGKQNEQ
ncbi:hypothetical protein FGB62_22g519 [Gracilaria domingensis]|nr:hypothetical protein FGB62_22g519 [Gracilaria domingensis]